MIAIVDYGVGNLFSLRSSFAALGAEITVTADPGVIRRAERIVLPGVGAFGDAVGKLRATGLDQVLLEQAAAGKPLLGICLGMQCMVIEFARDVLGLKDANSTEMEPSTPDNVIDLMEEQKSISNLGGTMRLGAYECHLTKGSIPAKAYGTLDVRERHRHRFEFNNEYREMFEANGMKCVGENPETHLVEVVEVPGLKWFVGTQYHPEYSSTVLNPHPLFMDFVRAAIENKKK